MKSSGYGKILVGFAGFLIALYVFTALASPWVYSGVEFFFPDRWPFRRVFNRVLMVVGLCFLWPLIRYWGLRGWGAVGVVEGRRFWMEAGRWFLMGVGMLAVLVVWQVVMGAREWRGWPDVGKVVGAFASGVAVGGLEEVLFRGVFLWGAVSVVGCVGKWRWGVAVGGSVFFSMAHFAKVRDVAGEIGVWSGFEAWGTVFADPAGWAVLGMRGVGLFLVGMCLCGLVLRDGRLWGAMGLHAGWVFGLKVFESMTFRGDDGGVGLDWLYGTTLLDGVGSFVMLSIFLVQSCRGKVKVRSYES